MWNSNEMQNVMLVEPNHLLREGLRGCLAAPGYDVIAAIEHIEIDLHFEALVDLLIMGPGTTVSVERQLASLRVMLAPPHAFRTVVVMDLSDLHAVRRLAALGLDAVLSKDITRDVLLRSLELIVLGQQIFPVAAMGHASRSGPEASARGHASSGKDQAARSLQDPANEFALSRREVQTICGLVHGASNKVIAQHLSVSEATIKAHVKSLLRKLGLANRTQAALWAISHPGAWHQPDHQIDLEREGRELTALVTENSSTSLPETPSAWRAAAPADDAEPARGFISADRF